MKIGAGIVCYYPKAYQLKKLVYALSRQECRILIADNTPDGSSIVRELSEKLCCDIIYNNENMGIAYAHNQIMQFFSNQGCEWVLLMDQDSLCPSDMIEKYKKYTKIKKAGIICPTVIYKGDDDAANQIGNNRNYCFLRQCIASASLVNSDCWKKAGGFDNSFFIDFVDFDFCYTIREYGYRIIQLKDVILHHELGRLKVVRLGRRKIRITNYPAWRKYFYTRNAVICYRKHRDYKGYELARDLLHNYLKVIMYENDKLRKVNQMNLGLIDGLKWNKT